MSYLKIHYEYQSNPKGAGARQEIYAQCFIINANSHITVLNELVNGKQCIVWLSSREADTSRKSSFGVAQLTSTTVSDTDGDGRIENVANIRSGYSCMAELIN